MACFCSAINSRGELFAHDGTKHAFGTDVGSRNRPSLCLLALAWSCWTLYSRLLSDGETLAATASLMKFDCCQLVSRASSPGCKTAFNRGIGHGDLLQPNNPRAALWRRSASTAGYFLLWKIHIPWSRYIVKVKMLEVTSSA